MSRVWEFALLGLGAGAIYALLGQGIVLIFRGSGVLNLAHGAVAMLSAFTFNDLNSNHGWPLWPALLTCVAGSAALGTVTDQFLLRRLRRSSPLTRLIATLAVLVTAQGVATLIWGATPLIASPVLPAHPVRILGATVTTDRLWLLLIAAVLTVVLTVLWRYTRSGWIAEAVGENQRGVAALGVSPEIVSSVTWGVGSALAGLAGILIAPISELSIPLLVLLVIPALAAALIGGFRSFPATMVGGLVIGIGQSEIGEYLHITGASDALPFLFIVAVLVVRGSALPLRGHVFDRLPEVGVGRVSRRLVVVVIGIGLVTSIVLSSPSWLGVLTATFATSIILLSLVVLVGYSGQLSLAQYALAGVGALVAARLVGSAGWPFPFALAVGVTLASTVGVLFALPALRTRGVNLAVVTLGLGLTVQSIFFNNAKYVGANGLNVGAINVFGWVIAPTSHPGRYAFVTFVLFVVCCLVVANLRRAASGRGMLALRSNERAAAASGVNITSAKLQAFAIGGALAGLGGVLLGFSSSVVTFGQFSPFASIEAVGWLVINGAGFIFAAFLGANQAPDSFSALISRHWQGIFLYLPILGGVGLMAVLVFNQNGVVSELLRQMQWVRRRWLRRHPTGHAGTRPRGTRSGPSPRLGQRVAPERVVPRRLVVDGVCVSYGKVIAVSDIDLHVDPGEIVALIGPNGAGKTTLVDALTGVVEYSGDVSLVSLDSAGTVASFNSLSLQRRALAGVVRTFQGLELFEDMSVFENLQVASDRRDRSPIVSDLVRSGRQQLPAAAAEAIDQFDLESDLYKAPRELPLGRRRLIAIARAVAMKPSVLLLDEPAAGLDDHETMEFARLVRALAADWGMAILVIEHDMDFVMRLADRVVVMDFGRKVAEGTPTQVRQDPSAIAAYLGEQGEEGNDRTTRSRPGSGVDLSNNQERGTQSEFV